jgi:hypothetical protein
VAYLTVTQFTLRTVMPPEDVEYLESNFSGYLDARIAVRSSLINARLQKRYAVPFAAPVPETVLGWLTALVTVDAYKKRGWNPSDAQSADIVADAKNALDEMKEAADSAEGLFELSVKESDLTSAVSKGGPLGYSETSPYAWTGIQLDAAVSDDENT